MELDRSSGGTFSYHRSSDCAPSYPSGVFHCRVGSRTSSDLPHPSQHPFSRPSRYSSNATEGRRNVAVATRGLRRSPHHERDGRARKGGDFSRGGDLQREREENQRQRNYQGSSELSTISSRLLSIDDSYPFSTRRVSQRDADEGPEVAQGTRGRWPGPTITHHQRHHFHHQHNDHHHYHYHYHHVNHHSRVSNAYQYQVISSVSSTVDGSSRRSGDGHPSLADQRSSILNNTNRISSPQDIVREARDRLDERFRNADLRSQRHRAGDFQASFLEGFALILDDVNDSWNNDEVLEHGVQDWLVPWIYEEAWHFDSAYTAHDSVANGLSKKALKQLKKTIYIPKILKKDNDGEDCDLEQDECSVCLEHFSTGQLLIHLPCHHSFHPKCLTPWLETHRNCPYCRAKINEDTVIKNHTNCPYCIAKVNEQTMT